LDSAEPPMTTFPAAHIHALSLRASQQHVQQRRHAVREGDLFLSEQPHQQFGRIATRIHLLHAEHCGDVRKTPGVHVEHRRYRHVDVATMKASLCGIGAEGGGHRQRVQHELPMREVHALRQSRGAGGVERRGAGVLVEVGKHEVRRAGRKQVFVLANRFQCRRRPASIIRQQNDGADTLDAILDAFQHWQEVGVHQQDVVLGVIDRVEDLLRGQPHIHHMQHGAHAGNGKITFEIAVTVPVQHADRAARLNAKACQGAGQPADALPESNVVVALPVGIDDLLIGRIGQPAVQQ
jgi:hypothetical protein